MGLNQPRSLECIIWGSAGSLLGCVRQGQQQHLNSSFLLQTAEKEEFEHQQKELEKVCNPIITKLYQSAGGMPGGMPGGFPGGGAPPSGGASSGPTIEEVD